MGRLTSDPELRHTPNGVAVSTFTLAINRRFTKAGEQKTADFIDIVCWRNNAEFASKYFRKGQQVAIVGSIQTRNWKDKDGNNRKSTEVIADEVFFADSKKDSSPFASQNVSYTGETDYTPATQSDFEEIETEDGELPF
jgi:single-strand DNA-binding protein